MQVTILKKSYDFAKKSEMPCGIAIHDKVAALYSRNKVLNQNPQLKLTTLLEKSCIIKIFESKYFMWIYCELLFDIFCLIFTFNSLKSSDL